MDPCFHQNVAYNCNKDGPCPNGYECCSHNKVKGTCVESGTCNKKTGLCESLRKPKSRIVEEDFIHSRSREGFRDKNNKTLVLVLLFLVLCSIFLLYLKFSRKR